MWRSTTNSLAVPPFWGRVVFLFCIGLPVFATPPAKSSLFHYSEGYFERSALVRNRVVPDTSVKTLASQVSMKCWETEREERKGGRYCAKTSEQSQCLWRWSSFYKPINTKFKHSAYLGAVKMSVFSSHQSPGSVIFTPSPSAASDSEVKAWLAPLFWPRSLDLRRANCNWISCRCSWSNLVQLQEPSVEPS